MLPHSYFSSLKHNITHFYHFHLFSISIYHSTFKRAAGNLITGYSSGRVTVWRLDSFLDYAPDPKESKIQEGVTPSPPEDVKSIKVQSLSPTEVSQVGYNRPVKKDKTIPEGKNGRYEFLTLFYK